MVEPVVRAAAPDGVVQFPSAVAGEDGHRLELPADDGNLGIANLVYAHIFEEKSLERLIGADHLVVVPLAPPDRSLARLGYQAGEWRGFHPAGPPLILRRPW